MQKAQSGRRERCEVLITGPCLHQSGSRQETDGTHTGEFNKGTIYRVSAGQMETSSGQPAPLLDLRGRRRSNGQNGRGLLCEERCLRGAEAFSRAEAGGESPSSLSSFLLISLAKWKLESWGGKRPVHRGQSVPQGTERSGRWRQTENTQHTKHPSKGKASSWSRPCCECPRRKPNKKGDQKDR